VSAQRHPVVVVVDQSWFQDSIDVDAEIVIGIAAETIDLPVPDAASVYEPQRHVRPPWSHPHFDRAGDEVLGVLSAEDDPPTVQAFIATNSASGVVACDDLLPVIVATDRCRLREVASCSRITLTKRAVSVLTPTICSAVADPADVGPPDAHAVPLNAFCDRRGPSQRSTHFLRSELTVAVLAPAYQATIGPNGTSLVMAYREVDDLELTLDSVAKVPLRANARGCLSWDL